MKLGIGEFIRVNLALFEYTHTRPSASQNITKLNEETIANSESGLNSRLRDSQACLVTKSYNNIFYRGNDQ